ncbi:exodeoxyribonuclease V subunit beta [Thiorhodococcus mannitoliphagus]|uniref:RecBCD enzyme subunit RecB n=1 Tax=Thiorhodococcus mannitoliphagus TaxID=329406 RepID=A0A6P1DQS9_9GAMM|nr:exodeoxyribonuclease V subunit beta [Thiorhodococcus mannitoliphagus]NEX19890.1 exodeoxyribonuclease V subunit beta [Thiorhodococcus mannitoliphagus]
MSSTTLDTKGVLRFPLKGLHLIEASAGTGKTYTIANLYLRHIVEGREVSQVLVVTFTIAATDELRGRIRARLFETLDLLERSGTTKDEFLTALVAQIHAGQTQDETVRRLRLAVRTMDEAAVFTIHSFCQRALTEFAFNSGQQFQMEVLTDDQELWREAVQDWWRRSGYPLDATRAQLFQESLTDLPTFRALLAPLLGVQERQLLPTPRALAAVFASYGPIETGLKKLAVDWRKNGNAIKQILTASKGLSRAKTSHYHPTNLTISLDEIDEYFASDEVLRPPPACFEVITDDCIEDGRLKTADPALDNAFFARCGEIWRWLKELKRDLRVAALNEAAAFAHHKVREAKQRAQRLSFDDLLTELRDALQASSGDALAESIRQQFPVAMIDEFQDTDPVQYAVFRRLYLNRPECGLIMIGDPKQAIYSFRGGDIFTYMQAKEDVGKGRVYTLDTNWRSTPEVIQAVNTLFERRKADAFVYGDTIPFRPTRAAKKPHRQLCRGGKPQAALTLWSLSQDFKANGDEKPISKERAREETHAATAAEIARLIDEGQRGHATLGDAPLRPKDIAVLVRTSFEAAELRLELSRLGVNAVSVEREGVFRSEEAAGLESLLQAAVNPRDRERVRLAVTSPLLAKDYLDLERITASEELYAAWVDDLLLLHETWQRKGFMVMFQQMLRLMHIPETLSRGDRAERRLTNLLHLGELLQRASKVQAGMDALLTWYRQQREASATDEAELRLESDAELVQLVTIHASKGLEYPVVFVPYLWSCKVRGGDDLLSFHQDKTAWLDAGSDDWDSHRCLAEQERLAEDVRLVYVALTRAESALYLVWGRAGSKDGHAGQTALGYLIHCRQPGQRLAGELPNAFADVVDFRQDLKGFVKAAKGNIQLNALSETADDPRPIVPDAPPDLAPRCFKGRIATDWRISSFSALTRDVHSSSSIARSEMTDDPGLRFPAGSHVGTYLHLLLETLDFQGDVVQQVMSHSNRIAARYGLDHTRQGQDAAELLARAIVTPLNSAGLTLSALRAEKRLSELEFDFSTGLVEIDRLNRLLAKQAHNQDLPTLTAARFRGLVNGVIDLVFEHEGRYYIADYKSNFLGGAFEDYAPARLEAAIFERRYDLQYLLYTLALHRYLRVRLADYDYDCHFGGVYYLFLRAMRPETGPAYGVYATRPPLDLVQALDEQIFTAEVA